MYPGQKSGDEYFRYILDAYSDMIVRLCYTYTNNMTDAEDIAEDTFCELVRAKPSFDSEEHEKAWLLRVAVNKCKNHLKSARVRLTVSLDDDDMPEIADTSPDPHEDTESGRVRAAVMALPEKYRTIIHLYYFEDLPTEKIAQITRLPRATVGTRLARGRALLKKQLGDESDV